MCPPLLTYFRLSLLHIIHVPLSEFNSINKILTLIFSRSTLMTCQLSVEKAMAKRAADTTAQMAAKHRVTALQNAISLRGALNWGDLPRRIV